MRPDWSARGACVGLDPNIFFPTVGPDDDDDNQGAEAKSVCASCNVRAPCLDWAIRTNEQLGIWGGVGLDRRRGVRRVFLSGNALAYQAAIAAEMDELLRTQRGATDTRPQMPASSCQRCGDPVPPGRRPADRNGPQASCGVAATYNRGCRCARCRDAKASYIRDRRRMASEKERMGTQPEGATWLNSPSLPMPRTTSDTSTVS